MKHLGIIKSNLQDFKAALFFKLKIREDFTLLSCFKFLTKEEFLGKVIDFLVVLEIRRSNFFKAVLRRLENALNKNK